MKAEHRKILDKIEKNLEQPGSQHLRFWQALFAFGVINNVVRPDGTCDIVDDFNVSDEILLKRIKDVKIV